MTESPASAPQTDGSDVDDSEDSETLAENLTNNTAVGYYLSTLVHLVAYAVAAVIFAFIGGVLEEDTISTPLRATLDDFERDAERPEFEITQELDIGSSGGESAIERLSNSLQLSENGLINTLAEGLPSLLSSDDEEDDSGSGKFLFKMPEAGLAVTKGSFTVWTEPKNPQVRQAYLIIIEVMLKSDSRIYRVNDLSGYVTGSDKYRQKIPFDPDAPNSAFYTDENKRLQRISGTEKIPVRNNKVQLAIRVPGANRLVKDTIQIRSRRLREKQELELVFGGR